MTPLAIVAGLIAAAHFIFKAYGRKGLTVAIVVPVALIAAYAAHINYGVYARSAAARDARDHPVFAEFRADLCRKTPTHLSCTAAGLQQLRDEDCRLNPGIPVCRKFW